MFKDFTLNRLLCSFTSIGFAFLAIDSAIEHGEILSKEYWSIIPVAFGSLGAVLAGLAVMKWNERWIRILHIYLFVGFLVAGTGMFFHLTEDDEDEASTGMTEQQEKDKPPLAPLAFAGLAAIGLLGTMRKWPAEVAQQ